MRSARRDRRFYMTPGKDIELFIPSVERARAAGIELARMSPHATDKHAATTPEKRFPPKALRCHDLKPVRAGGAYRSAMTEKRPDFHGFDFGDTLEQATESLERFFLACNAETYDIAAYAWPLLWLDYPQLGTELVLWVGWTGDLLTFEGKPRQDA
jgi:hypothetical protein